MEEETEEETEEEEITLGEKPISYVEKGYRIVCRGDDWAQLWRPKRFNGLWFLLWTFLGVGWGGLFYILYYISKGDRAVYIGLCTDGSVYGWESESQSLALPLSYAVYFFGGIGSFFSCSSTPIT